MDPKQDLRRISIRSMQYEEEEDIPKNGAAAKRLIAIPLCLAWNMSAMTPPALVKGEAPKAPAKKRRMIRVQLFCAPALPALKAVSAQ